jgi:hypothetical protein
VGKLGYFRCECAICYSIIIKTELEMMGMTRVSKFGDSALVQFSIS